MSMTRRVQVECPKCRKEYDITCWESLNGDLDPEAKERMLSGELFKEKCPSCGNRNNINYPLLYHGMEQKIMIKLASDSEQNDWNPKGILDMLPILSPGTGICTDEYRFRLVTSQHALREKVMIFECGLDDRAVEITKHLQSKVVCKKYPGINLVDTFFYPAAPFQLEFYADDNKSYTMELNMEMYELISSAATSAMDNESRDCYSVGEDWAASFAAKYLNFV